MLPQLGTKVYFIPPLWKPSPFITGCHTGLACFAELWLVYQYGSKCSQGTVILKVFFFKLINLFIYGCVGSSFLWEGFLQLWRAGATLNCGARASLVAEHRLQTRRLSSCDSRAQLLRGMWDLLRPGLEPMSPALAGRFSTTAPPGKPGTVILESPKTVVLKTWSPTSSISITWDLVR